MPGKRGYLTLVLSLLVIGLSGFVFEDGAAIWRPRPGTSWQWQLQGKVDASYPVRVYDVDGFDTSKRTVARLHRKGVKVICYVDVGTWERWRPDAGRFPRSVIGRRDGPWPGERWLDIRKLRRLAPIMRSRFEMCRRKGFDAIEPDNIDGYTNRTGFRITYADQLRYNRWLARQAHRIGLSIGLKNDPGQVVDLVGYYDWALTEDCFAQGWCYKLEPFVERNKAVFSAEYTDTGMTLQELCARARKLGFSAILKHRDLGAWRKGCVGLERR